MEFKDYYKILGVERNADQKAISQAFRKLARQYHPDVNRDKNAEAKFKEINEAHQVLSDPQRRAEYDQLLDLRQRGGNWEDVLRRGGARGEDGTYTVYGSPEDFEQFSEFFRQIFGGLGGAGGRRRRSAAPFTVEDLFGEGAAGPPAAAQDAEGTVEISLDEAFRGTTRTIRIPGGGGRQARSIEVTIPAGVRSGQRIRVAGQGPGGDLYLSVQIRPHPVFTRQGDDLITEVDVPVWVAALGGEVTVPTIDGSVTMKIPPGTESGRTLRLRGKGMPHLQGKGAGDELVTVRLVLPSPPHPARPDVVRGDAGGCTSPAPRAPDRTGGRCDGRHDARDTAGTTR